MKKLIRLFFMLSFFQAYSQGNSPHIQGYVKDLFMLYAPQHPLPGSTNDELTMNTIHNRLNFKWYASSKTTVAIEMRNRLFTGSLIREIQPYRQTIDTDNGYFDLSFIAVDQGKWFLHSSVDRAYIDWTSGNWQIRAGRQRINWGVNLVWNPNDIFNSFSYFDFDYEERPGTDAVKLQYYTSPTSSAELIYKLGHRPEEMALAGLYRFSQWDYDFQAIGGWVGSDWIFGVGWAGDIAGGGFRGEMTHFEPRQRNTDSEAATVASVSGDYTFPSSLYLHAGFLYNSHGKTGKAGGMNLFFNPNLSAKYLSFARYSLFGQLSYPVTPLLSTNLSGIANPCDGSFFVGPSAIYSLSNNLELMLTAQLFYGTEGSEFGDIGQLYFARLRWSF